MKRVVVVTLEGVGVPLLGAYGSSVGITPALDSLAARSLVLDQCFVDSQRLTQQLESLWTCSHNQQLVKGESLWKLLGQRGIAAHLITDNPLVARAAAEFGCESCELVDPPLNEIAQEESADCGAMALFAAAADRLTLPGNELLWIHSAAMRLPWDAPAELRVRFSDPEDPEPPTGLEPPAQQLTGDVDPDFLIGWGQAAAAQMAIIDEAMELLFDAAGGIDSRKAAWCILGLGGIPLGEHGTIGRFKSQLYDEEIHVPALIRTMQGMPIGERRPELTQFPDLGATILTMANVLAGDQDARFLVSENCWGRSVLDIPYTVAPTDWAAKHQAAWIAGADNDWLRTPAWSAVIERSSKMQLFVKPEDRWEISDISSRRADIVEQFLALLPTIREAVRSGRRDSLKPLDAELCSLFR